MSWKSRIRPSVLGSAAALAAATTGLAVMANGNPDVEPARTTAVVTHVFDGDTVAVATVAGRDLGRVRFIGINAPEVPHPGKPGECYGRASTAALTKLLPVGTRVTLVSDPTQGDRDVYDRLLRYVEHEGHDVGRVQVEAGAARPMTTQWGERNRTYKDAEATAQEKRLGLWDRC